MGRINKTRDMSSVLGKVSPHSWIHRLLFPSFMSFRLQLTTIDFLHALSCVLLFVWKTSILLSHLVRKMAVSGGGDWWQWFYIYTSMEHGYAGSICMIRMIKKILIITQKRMVFPRNSVVYVSLLGKIQFCSPIPLDLQYLLLVKVIYGHVSL